MPDRIKKRHGRGEREVQNSFWDEKGHLSEGLHSLSLAQLRPLVATTPYRRALWNKLMAFMSWPIMGGKFSYAFLGGGYVSTTPRPHDIDLILQTRDPYGPEAFRAIEIYFRSGLDSINRVFAIHLHFWMEDAPSSFMDYRVFFQYAKPIRQAALDRKGLICISLLQHDIKAQLARMLAGFERTDDFAPDCGKIPSDVEAAFLDRKPTD